MTLKIDLTNVEAWTGGSILPPGEYTVEVDDASEGTSSSGLPQLELNMRCVDGELRGDQIRDWIVFAPQTAGKVKQVLDALGVPADGSIDLDAAKLVGRRARIIVRSELYNGEQKSRVKGYEPAGNATGATPVAAGKKDDDDLPF